MFQNEMSIVSMGTVDDVENIVSMGTADDGQNKKR